MESIADASTSLTPRSGPFLVVSGTAHAAARLLRLRGFEAGRHVDA
jgi:hypothetical protein